ncbi:MAG: MarR family winged helix-turn-helix transcriptional regulator [Gemmatimonadaceae bacterium]
MQADMATVIDSIRSVFQSLRSSGRGAEQTPGISGAQMYVLEELAGGPALSINELAARTFTHQSSASMVVSRLVERRLVTRVVDRGDARKVCISLTPSGRALLKRKPHAGQSKLEEGLKNLSRSELKQLANTLGVLKEILSDQSRRSGRVRRS